MENTMQEAICRKRYAGTEWSVAEFGGAWWKLLENAMQKAICRKRQPAVLAKRLLANWQTSPIGHARQATTGHARQTIMGKASTGHARQAVMLAKLHQAMLAKRILANRQTSLQPPNKQALAMSAKR